MKIAIGSTNPVKINATKDALAQIQSRNNSHDKSTDTTEFVSLKLDNNSLELNNTPNSIDEMISGAKIRAEKSLLTTGADFGVGIEGGFYINGAGAFLIAYAVVINKDGNIGIGSAPGIRLPSHWKLSTDKTFELGTYVDQLTGNTNIKQKNGAMGLLTEDIITRKDSLTSAVICAYYSLINESNGHKD